MKCDHSSKDTQTDFVEHQYDMGSTNELERLQNEFEEYKRFSHGEILTLKAAIASRPNSPTQPPPRQNPPDDMLKEALLRSLHERITSLESQLQDKQRIIEKLLDGPKLQASTIHAPPTKDPIGKRVTTKKLATKNESAPIIEDSNNGAAQKQSNTKEDKIVKSRKKLVTSNQVSSDQPKQKTSCENRFAVLSIDDEESYPEVLNDQNEMQNPKGGQKKHNVNLNVNLSTERKSARKQKSMNDTTTNSLDNRAKVKVTMIGDSQLKRLQPEKLCNNHHTVDIRAFGGMKIQQAAKKLGKCDSNIIIVHAGTNNVQDSSPETLVQETMTTLNKIQKQNPSAQVVYSSVFRRKEHNEKVQKFNRLIEEEVSLNGIDFIDNSNIYFSNLWKDGLHINDQGIRKYAGNISNFIRYC